MMSIRYMIIVIILYMRACHILKPGCLIFLTWGFDIPFATVKELPVKLF